MMVIGYNVDGGCCVFVCDVLVKKDSEGLRCQMTVKQIIQCCTARYISHTHTKSRMGLANTLHVNSLKGSSHNTSSI